MFLNFYKNIKNVFTSMVETDFNKKSVIKN